MVTKLYLIFWLTNCGKSNEVTHVIAYIFIIEKEMLVLDLFYCILHEEKIMIYDWLKVILVYYCLYRKNYEDI